MQIQQLDDHLKKKNLLETINCYEFQLSIDECSMLLSVSESEILEIMWKHTEV